MKETGGRNTPYSVTAVSSSQEPAFIGQVEELLAQSSRALETGDHSVARTLLTEATHLDPSNQKAWLYLSEVAEDTNDLRRCLETVVAIDATSNYGKLARLGLTRLSSPDPSPSPSQPHGAGDTPPHPPLPPAGRRASAPHRPADPRGSPVLPQSSGTASEPKAGPKPATAAVGHPSQPARFQKATPVELARRVIENRDKGIAALKNEEYDRAIRYFELVLKDFPTDRETIQYLVTARKHRDGRHRASSRAWPLPRLLLVLAILIGVIVLLLMYGYI
ncbi:MAG: hypothetical protein HC884_01890 [Chloroflexaceae bacterium]|nr:hypothetical protein [Chloroflexaceae bacterium]